MEKYLFSVCACVRACVGVCVLDLVVYLSIKVENYSFNTKASKRITKLVNYG